METECRTHDSDRQNTATAIFADVLDQSSRHLYRYLESRLTCRESLNSVLPKVILICW